MPWIGRRTGTDPIPSRSRFRADNGTLSGLQAADSRSCERPHRHRTVAAAPVPSERVADFHVSLCQGEGAVLLARSGERALQPLQNSQSRTMPLGKVPAFAEPDIHSLSQAHGPSQKIEFVFAASPETIRREPREF